MSAVPNGTLIAGTYTVDGRLGKGAFGTVYRVRHRFLGPLALKLIPCESDDEVDQLAREGVALALLHHPNIVRSFDVNLTEIEGARFVYVASEYMSGGDLEAYLDQVQRLPKDGWKVLARDLLAALEHAHEQPSPVFHRDLKPANILMTGGKTPVFKVADFGVSALMSTRERIARAAGTIAFQAPECEFGSYVLESDIYGAALVLYRALTGTYPYALGADGGHGALGAGTKQKPVGPSRFLLDCTHSLDAVMLRALAPNPFHRYPSAPAFYDAIVAALDE